MTAKTASLQYNLQLLLSQPRSFRLRFLAAERFHFADDFIIAGVAEFSAIQLAHFWERIDNNESCLRMFLKAIPIAVQALRQYLGESGKAAARTPS